MATLHPVVGVMLFVGLTAGPLAGLLALLNRRDRRRAAVAAAVADLLPRDLRTQVYIETDPPMLFKWDGAQADLRGCTAGETLGALARWSAGLPPHIRLTVKGALRRGVPATWRIETRPAGPPCAPARAAAVRR